MAPATELNAALRLHAVAHRDDDVEVVVFDLVRFAIRSSCRKFCDNWFRRIFQLLLKRVGDMLANGFDIAIEQERHLRAVEPDLVLSDVNRDI